MEFALLVAAELEDEHRVARHGVVEVDLLPRVAVESIRPVGDRQRPAAGLRGLRRVAAGRRRGVGHVADGRDLDLVAGQHAPARPVDHAHLGRFAAQSVADGVRLARGKRAVAVAATRDRIEGEARRTLGSLHHEVDLRGGQRVAGLVADGDVRPVGPDGERRRDGLLPGVFEDAAPSECDAAGDDEHDGGHEDVRQRGLSASRYHYRHLHRGD